MGVVLTLFLTIAVSLCALAIDMGSLYLERRTVQGAADLAAIAAARDLDRAEAAARATLAANGFGDVRALSVIKGRYEPDPEVLPGARFAAGQEPFNAVRLHVATGSQLYFAKSFMAEPEISVSALGTADALAMFSIGSRLASLNGGVVNALLGSLLGGNVNLSLMDYNALANANVLLLDFLSALAMDVGLTAGTYRDVLNADVTVGTVLSAAAQAAASGGDAQAAQVVGKLLSQVSATATLPLSQLVDLGPLANVAIGQPHAGLDADLGLMSLITAAASLANGGSQVAVDLGVALPGLLSVKLDLAIGEGAQSSGWVSVGQPGASVRTAQTRLRLVAEVGGSGLLAGVRVRLPLYIEVASAEARLKDLACGIAQGGSTEAVIEARPAAVRAWVGDVAPGGLSLFGSSPHVSAATLVQVPLLLKATASAYTEMSNAASSDLSFTQSDVDQHVVKTAQVRDYTASLVTSLVDSLSLDVQVLGLGLGLTPPAIKTLLKGILTPVAALLDPIVGGVLKAVGLGLGEVDVRVNGIRCGSAVLAG
ncbi:pilus assembly protein TadG-related protein [Hyphomicrobium sp.]|uniref:pilus assembly protein TadG-related protein n=1 Tax=Hyphomicrobium sp. TaxID=82 RepID=UPI0025BF96CA|nr:pilus assembly protein TadG-related protein [Hyphomicrobium sp.]MCC7251238.1 hypothetical protein [Hyphomicrobium sp.]